MARSTSLSPTPFGGDRTVSLKVVSQMSFPVLGGAVSLGTGAALTIAGYEERCARQPAADRLA